MNKFLMFSILSAFLILSGCDLINNGDDTIPYGNVKVSGVVYLQNNPVSSAVIQIDDIPTWKVSTNGEGRFEIFRVAGGEHELKIEKNFEDGRVIGQRTTVSLSDQTTDLGSFLLPLPTNMEPIDVSQITSNSMSIKWEKSNDPEFVEYRIYRSLSPELNELTGAMIYSTQTIDEVEYTDVNFRTGVPVYYRVYVFTTFGRYAGSKIESATAPLYNLVKNSGFEESSSGTFPDFWVERIAGLPQFMFFSISTEDKMSGVNSAKVTYIESQANPHPELGSWGGIYQHVFSDNMSVHETYTFSFWLKMISGSMQVRIMKNGDVTQPLLYRQIASSNQWQEHKVDFKIDEDTRFVEIWINTKAELSENGIVHGFIDDLTIIK